MDTDDFLPLSPRERFRTKLMTKCNTRWLRPNIDMSTMGIFKHMWILQLIDFQGRDYSLNILYKFVSMNCAES